MAFTPIWNIYYPDNMFDMAEVPKNYQQQAETIESALSSMKAELAAVMASLNLSGIMAYWPGSTAPAGWALCDGSAHNSPNLLAILGSPYTPDFRDRFVVGAGPTFAIGSRGGAVSEVLQLSQLPRHSHEISVSSQAHSHGGVTSASDRSLAHNHSGSTAVAEIKHSHGGVRQGYANSAVPGSAASAGLAQSSQVYNGVVRVTDTDYGTAVSDSPHTHGIYTDDLNHHHAIPAETLSHSHTIAESGGSAPVSKLPPYVVASIIIRK